MGVESHGTARSEEFVAPVEPAKIGIEPGAIDVQTALHTTECFFVGIEIVQTERGSGLGLLGGALDVKGEFQLAIKSNGIRSEETK